MAHDRIRLTADGQLLDDNLIVLCKPNRARDKKKRRRTVPCSAGDSHPADHGRVAGLLERDDTSSTERQHGEIRSDLPAHELARALQEAAFGRSLF